MCCFRLTAHLLCAVAAVLVLHVHAAHAQSDPPAQAPPAGDQASTIEVERIINASLEDVWRVWTTTHGMSDVLGVPVNIDLRIGGPFEIHFSPTAPEGSRGSEGCKVLSFLPQRMLSFSWNAPPEFPAVRNGDRKTTVVVLFESIDSDRTRVRLHHLDWPTVAEAGSAAAEWQGTHEYFARAWPRFLGFVADYFDVRNESRRPARTGSKDGWCYLFVGFSRPDLLETMTADEKQILSDHFMYLKDLTAQGVVIVAGPCTDGKGPGIVIFEAPDEASAAELMNEDPAVKHGLFKAELHPMRLSLVRDRD